MRAKSGNRFDELRKKALGNEESQEATKPVRRPSVLGKRQEAVVAAASGKVRSVKVFGHDPKRIRPWAGHNRDYEALSKERCSDLIEGFRRADQQFPAIVRTVSDSDEYDYEFICGARRHWTATYLERDLIVEVRNLENRDAFLLQDIENRDREDISDYERASDYSKALPVYFNGNKAHMAEQLQIDPGNFNRLLALVDLPAEIVEAYADIRDLVVHHGTFYLKYLKDPKSKKRILSAAKKLHGKGASGKVVMSQLRLASTDPQQPNNSNIRTIKKGALKFTENRAGEFTVQFSAPEAGDENGFEKIKRDFLAALDEMASNHSRPKSAVISQSE